MSATSEATKTGGRVAIFGAISTIIMYGVNRVVPDLPEEVSAALLVLILAALAWLDNFAHEKGSDLKVPF